MLLPDADCGTLKAEILRPKADRSTARANPERHSRRSAETQRTHDVVLHRLFLSLCHFARAAGEAGSPTEALPGRLPDPNRQKLSETPWNFTSLPRSVSTSSAPWPPLATRCSDTACFLPPVNCTFNSLRRSSRPAFCPGLVSQVAYAPVPARSSPFSSPSFPSLPAPTIHFRPLYPSALTSGGRAALLRRVGSTTRLWCRFTSTIGRKGPIIVQAVPSPRVGSHLSAYRCSPPVSGQTPKLDADLDPIG